MPAAYPKVGTRGTGRRKEAICRVRLLSGAGEVLINGKTMDAYLGCRQSIQTRAIEPLTRLGLKDQYKVLVNANGGGVVGQADAIRLGIARALSVLSKDHAKVMRDEGFLTRDSRIKESKKYGRKKARKRFQFSKR